MANDSFFDAMGGWDGLGTAVNAGAQLYGNIQTGQNAQQNNQAVQQGLGQNAGTLAEQIAALQGQIGQGRQQATDAYNTGKSQFETQNAGLQNTIAQMTQNLQSLNDPNSPYMQQARQAMERKDAAAGRRSQWGEREVQLQALLADQMGKYAPGLNNSITSAQGQMQQNQSALADLYAKMTGAGTAQQQALNQLLQQQQAGISLQNTAGRGAAQNATNSTANSIIGGVKALSPLLTGAGKYFLGGGGGTGGDQGVTFGGGNQGYFGGYNPGQASINSGITGMLNSPGYDYGYGDTTGNYLGGGQLFGNNNYGGSSLGYNGGGGDYSSDISSADWW